MSLFIGRVILFFLFLLGAFMLISGMFFIDKTAVSVVLIIIGSFIDISLLLIILYGLKIDDKKKNDIK